jgi:hypothetical protein
MPPTAGHLVSMTDPRETDVTDALLGLTGLEIHFRGPRDSQEESNRCIQLSALSAARDLLKVLQNRSSILARRKTPRVASKRIPYYFQLYSQMTEIKNLKAKIAEIEEAMGVPTNPNLAAY